MSLSIKEVVRARQLAIEICNQLPLDVVADAYAKYAVLPDEYSQFVARAIASIWADFLYIPDIKNELGLKN